MTEISTVVANGHVDDTNAKGNKDGLVPPNEVVSGDGKMLQVGKKSVKFINVNQTFRYDGVMIEEEKSVFQKGGTLKFQEAIPIIPKKMAVFCLVLNILCPGLGTVVSGFAAIFCPCDPHMCKRWSEILVINITAGVCQLFTICYFFIGYFWGIYWGVLMVQKAPSSTQEKRFKVKFSGNKKQSYLSKK